MNYENGDFNYKYVKEENLTYVKLGAIPLFKVYTYIKYCEEDELYDIEYYIDKFHLCTMRHSTYPDSDWIIELLREYLRDTM
jgi:hypothetical protein